MCNPVWRELQRKFNEYDLAVKKHRFMSIQERPAFKGLSAEYTGGKSHPDLNSMWFPHLEGKSQEWIDKYIRGEF